MSRNLASANVALALIASSSVISTSVDNQSIWIILIQNLTYLSIISVSFTMLKMFIYSEDKKWETISEHSMTATVALVFILIIGDTICQMY